MSRGLSIIWNKCIPKNHALIFCVAAVLCFALVCIPLLVVAEYNQVFLFALQPGIWGEKYY